MVGQGEQPTKKTAKEIAREAEEEITCVARLDQVAVRKRHNDRQGYSRLSEDGARDGTPSRGHHPKFNQQL
jgi:hypothetical protein